MCRVFNKAFQSCINLHFTTKNKTEAWRKVLQCSIFLWMSQVVFVSLFLVIIIIVHFPYYDHQVMGSSMKPSQMMLSNWTPAEPLLCETIPAVPLWLPLLFRNPNDVTWAVTLSLPSLLPYIWGRERGHLTPGASWHCWTEGIVAAQGTGSCAAPVFSHLIWTHFFNKKTTWRFLGFQT